MILQPFSRYFDILPCASDVDGGWSHNQWGLLQNFHISYRACDTHEWTRGSSSAIIWVLYCCQWLFGRIAMLCRHRMIPCSPACTLVLLLCIVLSPSTSILCALTLCYAVHFTPYMHVIGINYFSDFLSIAVYVIHKRRTLLLLPLLGTVGYLACADAMWTKWRFLMIWELNIVRSGVDCPYVCDIHIFHCRDEVL